MAEDPIKAVCHYAQALKAPRIRESAARLAEQARDGGWSHEEYLAAVLSREVAAREASGGPIRIRSAGLFRGLLHWSNTRLQFPEKTINPSSAHQSFRRSTR